MLGDFDPSEVTFPPPSPGLRRSRPIPVPDNFGDEVVDYSAPYDAPAPRKFHSWTAEHSLREFSAKPPKRMSKRTARALNPSKKELLRSMKREVRAGIKANHCADALVRWKALAGSTLPGAKKAARTLKKTFANKCMRVPRKTK